MPARPRRSSVQRERTRRDGAAPARPAQGGAAVAGSPREAARVCAWCGGAIEVKPTGRIPKWCSAACRQRAWEQSRAAASGRAAVQVVERVVQVPVEVTRSPRHGEWPALLRELADQLDTGRIYPRDLPDLTAALTQLLAAYDRHPKTRTRHP